LEEEVSRLRMENNVTPPTAAMNEGPVRVAAGKSVMDGDW
jgi:hypothetical protein